VGGGEGCELLWYEIRDFPKHADTFLEFKIFKFKIFLHYFILFSMLVISWESNSGSSDLLMWKFLKYD